jgi:hypothetical protein
VPEEEAWPNGLVVVAGLDASADATAPKGFAVEGVLACWPNALVVLGGAAAGWPNPEAGAVWPKGLFVAVLDACPLG